ncbi:MAG TPA: hypothetical protein VFA45_00950 [Actinomycetes bacterium]|nr:hypothetical protein [Actinomycetes bacterium]
MAIIGGLDVHRSQITYDWIDTDKRAGIEAHLAEPADTSAARGPKRRAKTDQLDVIADRFEKGRLVERPGEAPDEEVNEVAA